MAGMISGHTYRFDDNYYQLANLRMDFSEASAEATVHLTFSGDRTDWSCSVGLDGLYRFTEVVDEQGREFLTGMRGAWTDPQTFVLEQNEIASPNAMELTVHFDGDGVTLEGPGLDGVGTISLEGRQE
jgi:hypothetical protein